MTDPFTREADIDRLVERIELADTVEQAQGYARQIAQLRKQSRDELAEAVGAYYEEELRA